MADNDTKKRAAGDEGTPDAKRQKGSKPVLGYWKIRGLAQPIRYALHYGGVDYEEVFYQIEQKDDGSWDRSCWYDVKYTLGLDFPNLPYYFDGDLKLTESQAILRHVARKVGLMGASEEEAVIADMMLGVATDFGRRWTGLCYSPQFEAKKAQFREELPAHLAQFEAYLGEKEWFAGGLTYCDLRIYDLLHQHHRWDATAFADCPRLIAYMARFEALPGIKEYMESDEFVDAPFNNNNASFHSPDDASA